MKGKWKFNLRTKKGDNRKGIRRHSNNKGRQQIKSGAVAKQVEGMIRRLRKGEGVKMDRLEEIKKFLEEDGAKQKELSFIPIMHNEDKVFLQLCGWSITLNADGTWHTDITEGG